jgi:hypothetical protein
MTTFRDATSSFAIVAAAPPDAPVSPGNGEDLAPPPELEKATTKRKKAKVADAPEPESEPAPDLQPPPIQPADKPFTIEDCFADMSQPPPVPPGPV